MSGTTNIALKTLKPTTPSTPAYRNPEYWLPRYWPTWLILSAIRLAALIPYRWQLRLGVSLGRLMYRISKKRGHIARVNLQLCFPKLDEEQREQLVRQAFDNIGITFFETANTWWRPSEKLEPLCEYHGLEHVDNALKKGKGVLLLSFHFTTLEIGCRLFGIRRPYHPVYKRNKNPLFQQILKQRRDFASNGAIERRDMRGVVRKLKQNAIVWYAPDQDFGPDYSVFAPFMGVAAATLVAPARIAKLSGAAVIPYFPMRLPGDKGYRVEISPPLENFPSGDEIADARRVNEVAEQQIAQCPSQYLWIHRRFKTRPPGEAKVYGFADKGAK